VSLTTGFSGSSVVLTEAERADTRNVSSHKQQFA
jgi:hypothetical protein